jgi:hypothetical protein
MLGIEQNRLAGRNPKKVGIEEIQILQKSATADSSSRLPLRLSGIEAIHQVESASWILANCFDTIAKDAPERLQVVGTRETASDANDRDRLSCQLCVNFVTHALHPQKPGETN